MKNRRITGPLLSGLFAALLLASALQAQGPDAGFVPPDPAEEGIGLRERLSRLVERVKYEQNRIETMQARLIQHRQGELLLEPVEDRGWFRYRAPDALRWEIVEPDPVIMAVHGDVATTWYVDLGTAKKTAVGRLSEQVILYMGPAGSLETLMEYFAVQAEFPEEAGDSWYLHLTPEYRRVEKAVEVIDIWIDPESFLPQKFRIVFPGGDERLVILEDLVLNEPIDDAEFILNLPGDVDVTETELN